MIALLATSVGVMVSKVDLQAFTSEFDSHWVPHSCGFVLHLSKKPSKLLLALMKHSRRLTMGTDSIIGTI